MVFQRKGFAAVAALAVLAVLALAAWVVKPAIFPGASRRAEKSAATTKELVAAKDGEAAAVAASLTGIGKAAAEVPESPATNFIRNEVPIALSRSPQPDATELLNVERRRVAFMAGKLDEQRRLTEIALKDTAALNSRVTKAEAAKAAADLALIESAAAEHARTVQLAGMGVAALLCLGLYLYVKFYGVSLPTLGKMAAGIRAGEDPIQVLTEFTAPWHHATVQKYARLASNLPALHQTPSADSGKIIGFPSTPLTP